MARILVVEDTASIRLALRRLLEKAGHEVLEADDGDTGVEQAMTAAPDLVLMDLTMVRMDGIEAIRAIRARCGGDFVPIVAVSASEQRSRWVDALEAGANDFVQKPYHPAELRARIETHLKVSALSADLARKNLRLQVEKVLARRVQENLLPRGIALPGFVTETFYRPSHGIGGDFYDFWLAGRRLHLLVADVSGHDTSAALLMAASRSVLRSVGGYGSTPLELVCETNRALLDLVGDSGLYLTMAIASLDLDSDVLEIVSAGHSPVLLRTAGEVRTIESTGTPLGMFAEGVASWDLRRERFAPGDALLLFTDGVIETESPDGAPFGLTRLAEALRAWDPQASPDAHLVEPLACEALAHGGGSASDDLTLFAIHRRREP